MPILIIIKQVCDFFSKCNIFVYSMATILENSHHLECFKWLTGFIKGAIPKEYVCQFWCLFPEMNDCYSYMLH